MASSSRATWSRFFIFLPAFTMNVFANTVVTLSFKLYDASNQLIEETDEPVAYLHGHGGIFP